ncbi:hypothetical protein C8Q80DRAFT_1267302 [Daedaleopsis nitida]|nr:hypothetical protein C8Q80DRAFT_1267302 [Daedaleopsis nitida]
MASTVILKPAHAALPPLALAASGRSKSRSDAIAMYPTSPLGVFPPPAPSVRRPLRDRCGFDLTLQIEAPYKSGTKPLGVWSPKGHLQPHRLPRRRNPKPCFANFKDVKTPTFEQPKQPALAPAPAAPAPALPTPLSPPKCDDPQLQAIIPAVWVAFNQANGGAYEEGFTHIVEICYAKGVAFTGGSAERRWEGRVQRIRLVLPESARKWEGRAALALNGPQLRAARDFIAEALPESVASQPDQTAVKVLVSTPAGRPTDAMCVLGCYLAFVAGKDAESILQCIDDEESIASVWKGEVSGDEMERIEKIARAWSWLSAVGPGRRS